MWPKNILFYLVLIAFVFSGCISQSVLSNKEIILGDDAANHYNYTGAITHFQNFCNINSKLGFYRNFERESQVLRKMAYAYSMAGDFKKALSVLLIAAKIDSVQNDALNLLDDLKGIGNCYLYTGEYKKGYTVLQKCINLSNTYESSLKQTHKLVAGNVYLSIGNYYALLSQYDSSDYYLNKAVKIFQNENESYGLMISLLKLGLNKVDLCNYNKGIELIKQSEYLANKLKLNTSEQLLALGEVFSATGDYENALVYKRRALTQADSAGNISQLIVCNISIGDLYTEVGDSKSALYYYNNAKETIEISEVEKKDAIAIIATRYGNFEKSLEFYGGSGATYSRAITLFKIGVSYFEKNNYDSCLIFLSQCKKLIFNKPKNDLNAILNIYKAASLIELGQYKNVLLILDSALSVNQNPENEWKFYYYKGRAHESYNEINNAENDYKKAIEIIENIRSKIHSDELKSSFMDKRIEAYDRLINLLNKQGKSVESFNYSEKARNRAFLDMLIKQKKGIACNVNDSALAMEDKVLTSKIIKLKEKITNYDVPTKFNNDSTFKTRGILETELISVNNDYNNFLLKLKANNSKLIQLIKPDISDVNTVIKDLDNNTVLLEYWLSSDNLYIWCVNNLGVHLANVPFDKNRADLLNDCLFYFSKESQKTTFYLSELYKILIAPVRDQIKENNNLIIVPHGLLHFVPFQALMDEKNKYMVEHFFISYAPSATIMKETRKNQHDKGNSLLAMAIGNISVDDMPNLPSTISEVKNIIPLFKNSVSRIEKECTIDYFANNASNYSYIHLATHGVYNRKNPLSSYILFSDSKTNDGKLKVSDIFGLKINANLVTLSACQTGLGNLSTADEFVGLSRAFIYAGTPSIIVSLRSVADDPTSKLMTYLYEYLKTNPTDVALTLAQRKLMITYNEPYYWAPFVLIGNNK